MLSVGGHSAIPFIPYQVAQQGLYEAVVAGESETFGEKIVFTTADIHYGGRVTDSVDQQLLTSLLRRCFSAVDPAHDAGDEELQQCILPSDYCYKDIKDFVMCLPVDATPEVLGLDAGAAVV